MGERACILSQLINRPSFEHLVDRLHSRANRKSNRVVVVDAFAIKDAIGEANAKTGKRFSANGLCQRFLQLYDEAGLDKITSHSGRRTFITGLAHKGVNVRVLAALAGHRNIATTQRYIELNDHVLRAAVELV